MIKNYYEILNIKPSATLDDIKTSFRKLALFWHPDRNSNPIAIEKMKELNEANEILSDKNKRMLYDKLYKQFFGLYSIDLEIRSETKQTTEASNNKETEVKENVSKKYSQEIEELNSWIKNIKFSLNSFDNILKQGLDKIDKPIENLVYYFPVILGVIFIIIILLLNLSK